MKLRFNVGVSGAMKWISHLDLLRVLARGMRRAFWPLELSGGFHPHPQLTWGLPLPVGSSAGFDPVEVKLREGEENERKMLEDLRAAVPNGLTIHVDSGRWVAPKPSLSALIAGAVYELEFPAPEGGVQGLRNRFDNWLREPTAAVKRRDGKEIHFNSSWAREEYHAEESEPGNIKLTLLLPAGQDLHVRPENALEAILDAPPAWVRVNRCAVLQRLEETWKRL